MNKAQCTKHFPSNRYSSLSRVVRAVFDRGLIGWIFKIHIGPGAGYGRWIFGRRWFIPTGWSLWLGHNVVGRRYLYRTRRWSIGITKNGNSAPWVQH